MREQFFDVYSEGRIKVLAGDNTINIQAEKKQKRQRKRKAKCVEELNVCERKLELSLDEEGTQAKSKMICISNWMMSETCLREAKI